MIYGCDCDDYNIIPDWDDYERWSEAFRVKGVFATEAAAKEFIEIDSVDGWIDDKGNRDGTGDLSDFGEGDRAFIEHLRKHHYFIEEMRVRD